MTIASLTFAIYKHVNNEPVPVSRRENMTRAEEWYDSMSGPLLHCNTNQ